MSDKIIQWAKGILYTLLALHAIIYIYMLGKYSWVITELRQMDKIYDVAWLIAEYGLYVYWTLNIIALIVIIKEYRTSKQLNK